MLEAPQPLFLNPRALLRQYGFRPKKGLGQHFLVDGAALALIVSAADLRPTDVVLEVGPGIGVLTDALTRQSERVFAVEIDPEMQAILQDRFKARANLEVVDADILGIQPGELLGLAGDQVGRVVGYKVVANLPYYITSAVLRHLLAASVRPELLVIMIQKEVALRILAEPGEMSILAVAVQLYAKPSLVTVVPAGSFYPPPKVDSAVLRLDVAAALRAPVADVDAFFKVVRAGFGQKRKQLRNSLAAGLGLRADAAAGALAASEIDPTRRAETLSLAEWAVLTDTLGGVERAAASTSAWG